MALKNKQETYLNAEQNIQNICFSHKKCSPFIIEEPLLFLS